jgi:hypothetical protein
MYAANHTSTSLELLDELHVPHAGTQLSHVVPPPMLIGIMCSSTKSPPAPQYAHADLKWNSKLSHCR